MIIFHEGLPGSGKSFEAMVSHIVPALQKGRQVFAYIEGLDHDRIAMCAGIPADRCRALLHQITREQVQTIYDHVQNDSLVVIDELQNFWPSGRQKLGPEITQFVTEHRHRGLDLLCMGQVLNDCHALWKGRVDTKFEFLKLDAVGKPTHYKWVSFKRVTGGKFQQVSEDKRPYDQAYFGTYASHTEGTSNTSTYADERTNVKNSKAWRVAKLYGAIVVVALGFIVRFYSTGAGMDKKKAAQATQSTAAASGAVAPAPVQPVAPVAPSRVSVSTIIGQVDNEALDYIDRMTEKGRIRLAGVLHSVNSIKATIEWRDDSNRIFERLTADQLRGMGWYVMLSSDGSIATISKPGKSYIATQWPLQDDHGPAPEKVPAQKQAEIAQPAQAAPLPVDAKPSTVDAPGQPVKS